MVSRNRKNEAPRTSQFELASYRPNAVYWYSHFTRFITLLAFTTRHCTVFLLHGQGDHSAKQHPLALISKNTGKINDQAQKPVWSSMDWAAIVESFAADEGEGSRGGGAEEWTVTASVAISPRTPGSSVLRNQRNSFPAQPLHTIRRRRWPLRPVWPPL